MLTILKKSSRIRFDIENQAMKKNPQRKQRAREKLIEAVRVIHAKFEQYLDKPEAERAVQHIDANDFYEALGGVCGRPTINRARALLGIRSVKIAGRFRWTFPTKAPDDLMQSLHEKRLSALDQEIQSQIQLHKEQRRPSVRMLHDYMEGADYDVLSREIMDQYTRCHHSKKTMFQAKRILAIASVKRSDGWHWIYPAPVIQEWLIAKLADGPYHVERLFREAFKEHRWSADVIRYTRLEVGGIKDTWIGKQRHWFDINTNPGIGDVGPEDTVNPTDESPEEREEA